MANYNDDALRVSVVLYAKLHKSYERYQDCNSAFWLPRVKSALMQDLDRFEKEDKAGLAKLMELELNKIRTELGIGQLVQFPAR